MPDFKQILEQTLIVVGMRGAEIDPFGEARFSAEAKALNVQLDSAKTAVYQTDDASVLGNRIWTWQFDAATLHRAEKLAVIDRHMNYAMSMTVCDSVEFGAPSGGKQVVFANFEDPSSPGAARVELPLTKEFLLAQIFTDGGKNPGYDPDAGDGGEGHFWPLEANLDASYLLAFGYELAGRTPRPVAREALSDPEFMPSKSQEATKLKAGGSASVQVRPGRIVVCISLVCCKERADFEPGEIVGMARFFPHVMAMASFPLTQFEAAVRLERPKNSPHTDQMINIGGKTPIENILVADTNQNHSATNFIGVPPAPTWDDQFDYYEVDDTTPFTGSELKVVSDIAGEREKAGLVKRHNAAGFNSDLVHKMPRQGAFDSIHVAPRMAAPTSGSNAPVVIDPKFGAWHFDKIAMAPFCFHDCMHTHIRWGLGSSKKINRGWDNAFNPCKTAGAPLAPHNQLVFLTLVSPSSFTYRAEVFGTELPLLGRKVRTIRPSTWQIINSHGSAYAIAFWPTMGTTVMKALAQWSLYAIGNVPLQPLGPIPTPEVILFSRNPPTSTWWMFYWLLRNRPSTLLFGSSKGFEERLEIIDLRAAIAL